MNIERLTEIAEWLEAGAPRKGGVDGFDMGGYFHKTPCETVCCIAGTAIEWHSPGGFAECASWEKTTRGVAADILDIGLSQAYDLFLPSGQAEFASKAWAARTIRRLIETGVVDWEASR